MHSKGLPGTGLKTLELSWNQNDCHKFGFLSTNIGEKIQSLQAGQDVEAREFLEAGIGKAIEERDDLINKYSENTVFFIRITAADDANGCRYEDVVLNVKENALTTTLSGKTFLDACAVDRDGGYYPAIFYIPQDKLTSDQIKAILA